MLRKIRKILFSARNPYQPIDGNEIINQRDNTLQRNIFITSIVIIIAVLIFFSWVMMNIPTKRIPSINQLQDQKQQTAQQIRPLPTIQGQQDQISIPIQSNTIQKNIWNIPKIQKNQVMIRNDPVLKKGSFVTPQDLKNNIELHACFAQKSCPQKIFTKQKDYYEQKYSLSSYKQQLPICVVVPTFNNVKNNRYQFNIQSILQQQYNNFKVIIIDDASEDQTGQEIYKYIQQANLPHGNKVTIRSNKIRKMALPNILDAAENFCKPYDIFIVIDGDDYLLGKQVFKLYNSVFQSQQQKWVVYSNFLTVRNKTGYSRQFPPQICKQNSFRKVYFGISHLRACYTKLILNIKEEDFKDDKGNWLRAANDVSVFIPTLEMACDKVKYIPQITYFYNSNTQSNNHIQKREQQIQNDRHIRKKQPYKKLEQLFTQQQIEARNKQILKS